MVNNINSYGSFSKSLNKRKFLYEYYYEVFFWLKVIILIYRILL